MRLYDSDITRWFSKDPLAFIDSTNEYEYALNSPSSSTDPSGLCVVCDITIAPFNVPMSQLDNAFWDGYYPHQLISNYLATKRMPMILPNLGFGNAQLKEFPSGRDFPPGKLFPSYRSYDARDPARLAAYHGLLFAYIIDYNTCSDSECLFTLDEEPHAQKSVNGGPWEDVKVPPPGRSLGVDGPVSPFPGDGSYDDVFLFGPLRTPAQCNPLLERLSACEKGNLCYRRAVLVDMPSGPANGVLTRDMVHPTNAYSH